LLSKITGLAPEEYTMARYLSSLLRLRSLPTEVTIKMVSIFAAITCSPPPSPAAPLERQVFLGRIFTIMREPVSGWSSKTTKSPTTGCLPIFWSAPEIPACTTAPGTRTSQTVLCLDATLPAR
jgi:hypothetical protein